MSIQLGNLAIVSGAKASFQAPREGAKAILIGNESGLTVTITMESGNISKTLYPSTVDWFAVNPGFSGNILINPQTILNNVSTFPASSLIFDAIGPSDPEQASMYPMSLNRNTNIGNQVTTVGGVANSIQNDANTAGTLIVESTVVADGLSAVSLTNDAHFALGTVTHPGTVSFDNAKITSDGAGVFTLVNRLIANLIKTVTGNDLALEVETAHKVSMGVNNSEVARVDVNGFTINSGKVNLLSGAIQYIIFGIATTTNAGVTVTTNWGVTPTAIFTTCNNLATSIVSSAGNAGINSFKVAVNTATSTNVWYLAIA